MKTETTKETTWLNKRIYAFCICLIISTLFWFLIVLSKDYTSVVRVPVKYANLPKDKIIVNKLPDYLTLEVNSFGFNLLRYKFNRDIDPLIVNVGDIRTDKKRNKGILVTNSRVDKIMNQLGSNMQVIKILPDTLHFLFDNRVSKRVPIKLKYSLDFEKQYQISDSLEVKPKSIVLSGAKSIVDSIHFVETELFKINEISQTVTRTVPVKIDKRLKRLDLSTKKVIVTVPVEKFTEASAMIPVHLINLPPQYTGKTFPEKVRLTYLISLKDFQSINPALFHVVGDYHQIQQTKGSKIKLTIVEYPDFVKNIKIEPEKVEFILMKK